ncbi:MAG: translation initiation factor IF-5A [Nitrososphaeria archaeon]|jgi:translation initiation factor 5A
MTKPMELGDIKEGSYMMIDGSPCKVVEVEKSKPGKHGSAKVRVVGIDIFTGAKKSYVGPSESKVEVPIIEKGSAQVVNISGNVVQLMDLQTFQTIDAEYMEEDIRSRLQPGQEVEYWKVLDKVKIIRIKS